MSKQIKEYPITAYNSTVCGYPGSWFDWSKFDWKGGAESRSGISPKPWVDGNASEYCEYLHVPFNWVEQMTIYRVRPSSFTVGHKRYGREITNVKVIEHDGKWFWQVTLVSKETEAE